MEANKLMSNKNNETEKEKKEDVTLCPDCPMKNDLDLMKKAQYEI